MRNLLNIPELLEPGRRLKLKSKKLFWVEAAAAEETGSIKLMITTTTEESLQVIKKKLCPV